MDVSLDLNFYLNKISKQHNKDLLINYYKLLKNHIYNTKTIITTKNELILTLKNYKQNSENNIFIDKFILDLENSIELLTNDCILHKNNFITQFKLMIDS